MDRRQSTTSERTSLHSYSTHSTSKVRKRTENDLELLKKELAINDHLITLNDLCKRYKTDLIRGLNEKVAAQLLEENGPNLLVPSAPKSRWLIFVENMFYGFSALLWTGAVLSLIGFLIHYFENPNSEEYDHLYIALVLTTVVLITGFIGFYQEAVNNAIMESFSKMVPKFATVVRDGEKKVILAEEIVLGDLVIVALGDCVPADIRVIEAESLKVDNSSLTGESEPQTRSSDCTDKNPMETQNLAFFGTSVVEGSGRGIVIACGDDTLMGHIAGLTSGLQTMETPMKKEVKHFMKIITAIACTIGLSFFILSMLIGYTFFEAFVYFIAIIVANVPEGLIVTLTICLTLTAKRMSHKNCLVKNLQSIETLGSTSVICSDKTGTLTQNRMTVSHMYFDDEIVDVLESFNPNIKSKPGFSPLTKVGILCSRAEFSPGQESLPIIERNVVGDASERAVLKCMELLVGDTIKYRTQNPKLAEIPFNSTNKYQVSIHRMKEGGAILVMKGAPERIMDRCSTILTKGRENSLSSDYKKNITKAINEMGYMGERVLGFADLVLPQSSYPGNYIYNTDKLNFPLTGLRFCGLMSMIDPARPGVPDAVLKCKSAGIRVYMVTGDHPITAMAIARKVGIISKDLTTVYDIAMKKNVSASKITAKEADTCEAGIITGTDLKNMEMEELQLVVKKYKEIVFARTSPQQKLKIVEAMQGLGNVVAVTGDGVNDSPALKKADIGIAMGISGSEVSKEAADMIILDDDFTSIVQGIEEGRLIFDNLKKSIAFIMTSNVPEIIPFLLFCTLNIPPVLGVMAIMVINVGTDLWPGMSLAYEKPEMDIMKRQPRNIETEKLVNIKLILYVWVCGIIQATAGMCCYFYTLALHGFFYYDLLGIRKQWLSRFINDVKDSYGQEWTFFERDQLTKKCFSAYFFAIVITQVSDVMVCKTRRLSIFQQGMNNWVLNFGAIFEVILAIFVVYCPKVNNFLFFEPVELQCILPSIPFFFIMFILDEIRKLLIRRYPGSCVYKETYY